MAKSSKMRILCIEDEPSLGRILQKRLGRQGYAVTLAASGEEGLATCDKCRFDAIALDYSLPGISGIDVLRTLSKLDTAPPVVMVTGQGNEEVAVQAMKFGASDYVLKDIQGNYIDLLPGALERACVHRRLVKAKAKADHALRESEERFQAIANYTYDWESWFAPDGRLMWVNPAVEKLTGYTVAQCEKMPDYPLSIVYQNDRMQFEKYLQEAIVKRLSTNDQEFRISHKDESIRWMAISWQPIYDSQDTHLGQRTSVHDITERKWTEQALRNEKRFIDMAFDSLPGIFYLFTEEGKFLRWNQNFEKVSGYTAAEISTMRPRDFFPVEEQAIVEERIGEVFADGESFVEANWLSKNGTKTLFYLTGVRVNIEGTPCQFGMGIDMSDRKRAEEEREKLQAQLLQSQKMESIGILAGGIAHDFNNILSSILGYSELALLDLPPESPMRIKLEAVYTSGKKARELVAQILAFSRNDEQVRTSIKLHLAVEDALKLLRHAIPSTIHIQTETDSNCWVMGDPSRINQAMMNLCTNAYQAMLETGGTLKISLSRVEMSGKAAKLAGIPGGLYGKLSIADTGVGIPAKQLERIFEPYFTTKEKGKGTGLGLAVVHGIVKSHKGAIFVKSEVGKGTRFEVYLPLTRNENVSVHKATKDISRGSERILLVDDQEDVLQIETEMLEMLGYDITGMISARETLDHFAGHSNQYDLVITDMTMPHMTGDRLAEQLRKIRSDIPIVLTTGFSELISREKAESMGIDGFLTKPVQLSDMAEMIRKVIDGKSK